MEALIHTWFRQAEETWQEDITTFSEDLFMENFLPSHDPSHHRRVWSICKELLYEISTKNTLLDASLVEGILIASLFHDLGMVRSTQPDHGKLGRILCQEWFEQSRKPLPERFSEILDSIEMHDVKDQGIYAPIQADKKPKILSILSMADDLDAFGTTGIFRYTEIYLKRGIDLKDLGNLILDNAASRYQNLLERGSLCDATLQKYHSRYLELKSFFELLKQQLENETQPLQVFTGHLGVINYIRTLGMEKKIRPEELYEEIEQKEKDATVLSYFRTLEYELGQAHI